MASRILMVLLCVILLHAIPSGVEAQQTKPSAATKSTGDPLKGLYRQYDKMRGISWYRSPSSPKYPNSNAFYLYFGKDDSGHLLPLRLVVRYYADDWLFVRRAWAKADGATTDIPQSSSRISGWERDNRGGMIWEWSDTAVTTSAEIAEVRRIANAKSVTVRFEGRQYYDDRTLSAQQLSAMRDLIAAYESVTGKPWK